MEERFLNEQETAEYLNLDAGEIRQRVKYGEIPFQLRGKRVVFPKSTLDQWASQRILNLSQQRLMESHHRVSKDFSNTSSTLLLPSLISLPCVNAAMTAKTKSSILHELVTVGEHSGHVLDPKGLVHGLESREKASSTAMPGGFALPHPVNRDPYLFASSFVAVGRLIHPVNFGAADDEPTRFFFLICCTDALHLKALARICTIAEKTTLLQQLNDAPDAETIFQITLAAEQEVISGHSSRPAD